MTATAAKLARRTALRALKVGDTVRVVRLTETYAREPLATATVVKVLAGAVRVAWGVNGAATTDFTRDSGKRVGERQWVNYPMIEVA